MTCRECDPTGTWGRHASDCSLAGRPEFVAEVASVEVRARADALIPPGRPTHRLRRSVKVNCLSCGYAKDSIPGEGCEKPGNHGPKRAEVASVDMVNEPPHYKGASFKGNPIEPADVVEAFGLHTNHYLATVFYYIVRAGKKGPALMDLQKARWFLDREIKRIGGE